MSAHTVRGISEHLGTATNGILRGQKFQMAGEPFADAMNSTLEPRGWYDAVMATNGLFQVEPVQ